MKEYELLRTEMISYQNAITQYSAILYTAVAAILVFALQKDTYYLCLVPYIVILPLYLLSESKSRGICKMAAYMYVYLEGEEYFWEQRHHKLDLEESNKRGSIIPYYYLAISCSACAVYKIVAIPCTFSALFFKTGVVVVVTIITIIIMSKNKVNYNDTRKKYIDKWSAQKNPKKDSKLKVRGQFPVPAKDRQQLS